MRSKSSQTAGAAGSHSGKPDAGAGEGAAGGGSAPSGTGVLADTSVARRTAQGWRIGDEEVPDLTSAMVLADLIASELAADSTLNPPPAEAADPHAGGPAPQPTGAAGPEFEGGRGTAPGGKSRPSTPGNPPEPAAADPRKLAQTVAQLELALTARVRVEQAIGVLSERHRLRPRQAFELLRSAARDRGQRVLEIASEVVDSATNPLLRIPEELAKPPVARRGGRMQRRTLESS